MADALARTESANPSRSRRPNVELSAIRPPIARRFSSSAESLRLSKMYCPAGRYRTHASLSRGHSGSRTRCALLNALPRGTQPWFVQGRQTSSRVVNERKLGSSTTNCRIGKYSGTFTSGERRLSATASGRCGAALRELNAKVGPPWSTCPIVEARLSRLRRSLGSYDLSASPVTTYVSDRP
ncbi:hypothetical protein SAMN05216525_11651 [Bradyrhizobium sp. Gha]|nr:hypothetical protein SAMN05216525_11651 [Bradyrhizobium sp. Gha]